MLVYRQPISNCVHNERVSYRCEFNPRKEQIIALRVWRVAERASEEEICQ